MKEKQHAGTERKTRGHHRRSQGLGLAVVQALAACGANVTAIEPRFVGSAVLGETR